MTRSEVEALSSYRTCRTCAPNLSQAGQPRSGQSWVTLKASSLTSKHVGRAIYDAQHSELGMLLHATLTKMITVEGVTEHVDIVVEGGHALRLDGATQLTYPKASATVD